MNEDQAGNIYEALPIIRKISLMNAKEPEMY